MHSRGRALWLLAGLALVVGLSVAGLIVVSKPRGPTVRAPVQPPAIIAGNPQGHYPIPRAGQAVSTAHPNHVVGTGSPASCTSAALVKDVAHGGIITFDCGPGPVTIRLSATARVNPDARLVVLDGGGTVTVSGEGKRRILFSDTCSGAQWNSCVNRRFPKIVLQNITLAHGYNGTPQASCTANVPRCGYGGVDGGGAVYIEGGQFKAVNTRFVDNGCFGRGPDLGGGAIRALLQYDNRPVFITRDTFIGGRCSNGGALSSISVQWDILDSRFTDNHAIGFGANPAAPHTPGGGSGGAVYLDGRDDNALIAGTAMIDNSAREGGGAVFDVVDSGYGSATFISSTLLQNVSDEFETVPGVFYLLDGHHQIPVRTDTIDR